MNDNPIASLSAENLRDLWHKIGRLTVGIRVSALLPGQAKKLGGLLFPNAGELVVKVAHGLDQNPALFPDGAATARQLLDRQARADAAFDLRGRLLALADQLGDYHLQEQSAAVRQAQTILRDIKTRTAHAGSNDERRRCFLEMLAMASPLKLVNDYKRGLIATRERHQALREQAAASEHPPALPAPKSPQKLRAEQEAKALAISELHHDFDEHMGRWMR